MKGARGKVGFSTFYSRQAKRPSGIFGRFVMPVIFDRGNAFLNGLVLEAIAEKRNQRHIAREVVRITRGNFDELEYESGKTRGNGTSISRTVSSLRIPKKFSSQPAGSGLRLRARTSLCMKAGLAWFRPGPDIRPLAGIGPFRHERPKSPVHSRHSR